MKINFQNMCSLRKISCGLIFSMAISLVACDSDNDEEGGDNGDDLSLIHISEPTRH